MRLIFLVVGVIALAVLAPDPASAGLQARVSKSTQTMHVYVQGKLRYSWPVSTGRGRYATPSGSFRPQRLERRWYSTKYNRAPMHYAVFYHRGYAIHATTEVNRLGRPAPEAASGWLPATRPSFSISCARTAFLRHGSALAIRHVSRLG